MRYILSLLMVSVMAVLIACTSSAAPTSSQSVEKSEIKVPAAQDDHAEHKDETPRISLEDAKKAFDAGEAIFIDTRPDASFKNEHVKGAINIPVSDFENRYKNVPKDKKIVVYCSWPSEHTSARVVQMLTDKGYKNAYALLGGTAAWKNAGYPMESDGDKK